MVNVTILHKYAASHLSMLAALLVATGRFDPEVWYEIMAVKLDCMFFSARAHVGRLPRGLIDHPYPVDRWHHWGGSAYVKWQPVFEPGGEHDCSLLGFLGLSVRPNERYGELGVDPHNPLTLGGVKWAQFCVLCALKYTRPAQPDRASLGHHDRAGVVST